MESLPENIRPLDITRRSKPVVSRQVCPDEAPSRRPGMDAAAARSDSPPVVDPSRLGRRFRKPLHALRYRVAFLWTGLSILLATASLIWTALGDHLTGHWLGLAALPLALLSILVSWTTRLSSRLLGYALAAAVLAFLALLGNALFVDLWP